MSDSVPTAEVCGGAREELGVHDARKLNGHPTWKHALVGLFALIALLSSAAAFTITRAEAATEKQSSRTVDDVKELTGGVLKEVARVEEESKVRDEKLEHQLLGVADSTRVSNRELKDDIRAIQADLQQVLFLLLEQKTKKDSK